jgi:hypothetical protein
MAAECRSVCMVTRLPASDGHLFAAVVTARARRRSMASRLSLRPVVPGNSGSPGSPGCPASQAFRTFLTAGTSGVRRSFLPLCQCLDKGRYLDVSVIPTSA